MSKNDSNSNIPLYSNPLKEIFYQFILIRINTAIQKKTKNDKHYQAVLNKCVECEEKLNAGLTEEQKELFSKYDELSVELSSIEQEYIYRRGFIDAHIFKDIFISSM